MKDRVQHRPVGGRKPPKMHDKKGAADDLHKNSKDNEPAAGVVLSKNHLEEAEEADHHVLRPVGEKDFHQVPPPEKNTQQRHGVGAEQKEH